MTLLKETKDCFSIGSRECIQCGKEFICKNNRRIYCSHKCKGIAYMLRKNPFMGTHIGEIKYCKYCGNKMVDNSKSGKKLYCSRLCRDRDSPSSLLKQVKQRALKKGIEFNLEKSDIIIPKFCPILGIPLRRDSGFSFDKPSIDRIDNSKGYIKSNIQIISLAANALKCDMPIDIWLKVKEMIR